MANRILVKKSSVAGKVPTSSDIDAGELAINLADRKLYSKDTGGSVFELGAAGALWRFHEIAGDVYFAINATWDGTHWQRIDTARPSFLTVTNVQNDMLYESYKAQTFWTCQPGENPIAGFTVAGGWFMAFSISEFKDYTIGGSGIEVDGNFTSPYGRLQHTTVGGVVQTGIMRNAYLDESGRDDTAKTSWWAGFTDDGAADAFKIRRAPTGASLAWSDLLTLDAGALTVPVVANFTGEVRLNGSAGTAGQVLTSQGSGTDPIWTTPSTGGGSPTGAVGTVQYNAGGTFGSATYVKIDGGNLVIARDDSPTSAASDTFKLFGKHLAHRLMPAINDEWGWDYTMQPAIWREKCAWWNPPGNATTVPGVLGFNAPTALGTATARNVATTNLMTRTRRLGYVSGTTAASFAGHYGTQAQWTTGDGAGLGGFFYSCRFACTDAAAVSGVRMFVGLSSSVAAPSNAEPSTLTNSVGIAQLSTDSTQLYLVYGGSAAQGAIALGTNFPPFNGTVGNTSGPLYDLTLFSPPATNGVVHVALERVGTGQLYVTTLTPTTPGTQTPANTTLLAPRAWRCNNATALACAVDIVNLYLETDY